MGIGKYLKANGFALTTGADKTTVNNNDSAGEEDVDVTMTDSDIKRRIWTHPTPKAMSL